MSICDIGFTAMTAKSIEMTGVYQANFFDVEGSSTSEKKKLPGGGGEFIH